MKLEIRVQPSNDILEKLMKSDMGITPNVPGTGPVTDIPQPNNDPYGNEPGAPDVQPGVDPGSEDPGEVRIPADTARQETNPFSGAPTGGTGGVNPSGPTTGTEAGDRRSEEANSAGRKAGQTGRSSTMANLEQSREGNVRFRCSEVHPNCNWEASGKTEDELMPKVEQHGREKHGLQALGQEIKDKIRNAMHRNAA